MLPEPPPPPIGVAPPPRTDNALGVATLPRPGTIPPYPVPCSSVAFSSPLSGVSAPTSAMMLRASSITTSRDNGVRSVRCGVGVGTALL